MKTLLAQTAFCALLGIVAYSIATEYTQYNAWFNENISHANHLSGMLTGMGIKNKVCHHFDIVIQKTRLFPKITDLENSHHTGATLIVSILDTDLEAAITRLVNLLQTKNSTSNSIESFTIRAMKTPGHTVNIANANPIFIFHTANTNDAKELMATINQELKNTIIKKTIL